MGLRWIDPLSQAPQATNAAILATDLLPIDSVGHGGAQAIPISELDKRYASQPTGGTAASRVASGTHVPTSGEVSADTLTIATGLTTIKAAIVQVVTTSTGKTATSDAEVSWSAGNLTIANGSSFTLATTQTLIWIATGT